MAWNQKGEISRRKMNKYTAIFAFVGGFVLVFAIWNIQYVYNSSSTKELTTLTEERMQKIQNEQILRIKDLLFPDKGNTTSIPTTKSTAQTPTSESVIVKQLNEIRNNMKDFDDKIKKLADWESYRVQREKLKTLVHVQNSKESENKKYSMFRPHVLVDKVTLDCKEHYKVIVLVTSFAKHFDRRQWIRKAWGNQTFWNETHEHWQVIFNIGAVQRDMKDTYDKLMEESQKYGDMLILDIQEDFHKLSQKVMT
uniref:Hexosyltransferase n=2 Tax=Clytia hemisphaerica TaxID=252671 RepID=A0A7M5X3Y4_9CNID